MNKKLILLGFIILLFMFTVNQNETENHIENHIENHTGNTIAIINGDKITSGDVENFKKYRHDNISDKQVLEMIIEKELLYKESQDQGKASTLMEARVESYKEKDMFEKYGTEQDKKKLQDVIKKLGISEKEYWNDYWPKVYRKQISIERMKKTIKDKIYADIFKNHDDWGQPEIEKGFNESYSRAISDLKSKYNLKYVK